MEIPFAGEPGAPRRRRNLYDFGVSFTKVHLF
jgi:hypothetical protein